MVGEMARSYPPEELNFIMTCMGVMYALGFVLGPVTNFAFRSVDFYIGSCHFTYVNVPGLVMAALFSLSLILSFFMLTNLSKVYDMKQSRMEASDGDECDTYIHCCVLMYQKMNLRSRRSP